MNQCPICHSPMVEKPLFTSMYWECPMCEAPKAAPVAQKSDDRASDIYDRVGPHIFQRGDRCSWLGHLGTVTGTIVWKGRRHLAIRWDDPDAVSAERACQDGRPIAGGKPAFEPDGTPIPSKFRKPNTIPLKLESQAVAALIRRAA